MKKTFEKLGVVLVLALTLAVPAGAASVESFNDHQALKASIGVDYQTEITNGVNATVTNAVMKLEPGADLLVTPRFANWTVVSNVSFYFVASSTGTNATDFTTLTVLKSLFASAATTNTSMRPYAIIPGTNFSGFRFIKFASISNEAVAGGLAHSKLYVTNLVIAQRKN